MTVSRMHREICAAIASGLLATWLLVGTTPPVFASMRQAALPITPYVKGASIVNSTRYPLMHKRSHFWRHSNGRNSRVNNQYYQSTNNNSGNEIHRGVNQGNSGNQGYNRRYNQDNSGNSGNQIVNHHRSGSRQENNQYNRQSNNDSNNSFYLGSNQGNSGNSGYNEGVNEDNSGNSGNQVIN